MKKLTNKKTNTNLSRNLALKIQKLMTYFPAVVILGVRQCGKSTLSKMIAPNFKYFDLENINDFERITSDIQLFFKNHPEHIIIDEAQKSPELFQALRGIIDANRKQNGRFILTGSASFELLSHISESLAGRVGIIELMPFKLNELIEKPLAPFFQFFEEKKHSINIKSIQTFLKKTEDLQEKNAKKITHLNVKKFLLSGGYPDPVLSKNLDFKKVWMENYFNTYINRDIRSYYPKIDFLKYNRLVTSLSYVTNTIINKSELARSIETSEAAVRDYMQIIEGTFFWRSLPSFHHTKIKNTLKLSKGHFRDSGLNFYLQRVYTLDDLESYPRLGQVFESFVVEELIKGIESSDAHHVKYYHYRTKSGNEIDLILEGDFGIIPIEIKYQSSTNSKKIESLLQFIEKLNLNFGLVINNADRINQIHEKVWEIPVSYIL